MVGGSSPEADRIGSVMEEEAQPWNISLAWMVSMAETHVCVMTRNGAVVHQAKVPSTPADIA